MNNSIDRQLAIDTAIDAVDSWDGGCNKEREKIIREALEKLPSTETEIIRCKDCKYYDWDCVDMPYGMTGMIRWCNKLYDGDESLKVEPTDFCKWAERKADE